jgi:hypothetical protein
LTLSQFETPSHRVSNGPDSVYIEFESNGQVKWRQGTTGNNKQGNIWIDDDFTYYEHRKGGSDDHLGLVAENNVSIVDNADRRGDLKIRASAFAVRADLHQRTVTLA